VVVSFASLESPALFLSKGLTLRSQKLNPHNTHPYFLNLETQKVTLARAGRHLQLVLLSFLPFVQTTKLRPWFGISRAWDFPGPLGAAPVPQSQDGTLQRSHKGRSGWDSGAGLGGGPRRRGSPHARRRPASLPAPPGPARPGPAAAAAAAAHSPGSQRPRAEAARERQGLGGVLARARALCMVYRRQLTFEEEIAALLLLPVVTAAAAATARSPGRELQPRAQSRPRRGTLGPHQVGGRRRVAGGARGVGHGTPGPALHSAPWSPTAERRTGFGPGFDKEFGAAWKRDEGRGTEINGMAKGGRCPGAQ
jgi:hypothetical protein